MKERDLAEQFLRDHRFDAEHAGDCTHPSRRSRRREGFSARD
jgi:hypothetical protein